ncbi:hypothetical protein ACQP1P_33870 [Dactylosporangium sp. CA-052675]|uniref:hypothetical protein n=1 Tax=Dactylosporangium sp. CA-052675 TaxID=3239927 RepID=UPI003D8E8243
MEILPGEGEGVALVKVGEHRDVVEGRLGPPVHPGRSSRAVYGTSPMIVLTYTGDTVELVELADGDGGEEVFFDGVLHAREAGRQRWAATDPEQSGGIGRHRRNVIFESTLSVA